MIISVSLLLNKIPSEGVVVTPVVVSSSVENLAEVVLSLDGYSEEDDEGGS